MLQMLGDELRSIEPTSTGVKFLQLGKTCALMTDVPDDCSSLQFGYPSRIQIPRLAANSSN